MTLTFALWLVYGIWTISALVDLYKYDEACEEYKKLNISYYTEPKLPLNGMIWAVLTLTVIIIYVGWLILQKVL